MPTKTPKRRKKVQEIPFWKLWQWMIQRSTNRNISGRFPARNHSLYTDDLALMSGPQNVTVFYTIDAYDHEVPLFMRSRLRARLGSSQYTLAFFTTATPFDADWTKGKLKNLLMQSDNLLSGKVDMPASTNNLPEKEAQDVARKLRRAHSTRFFKEETEAGRSVFTFQSYMALSGPRGEGFDRALEAIVKEAAECGLHISRVEDDIASFLSASSALRPASRGIGRRTGKMTLPDEIIARFSGYDQGIIGSRGMYIATDISTLYPILKLFHASGMSAENVLVIAQTGGGKSYIVKTWLIGFLNDPRIRITVNDVEGSEYEPIAALYAAQNPEDVVIVDMGGHDGKYFDPLEIAVSEDRIADDMSMYDVSAQYTLAYLSALVGRGSDSEWARQILQSAVSTTYSRAGVSSLEPHTWHRSEGLSLFDVYAVIKQQHEMIVGGHSDDYRLTDPAFAQTLTFIRAQLAEFFEPDGASRHIFSHRVSIKSVKDARFVSVALGMASRTSNTMDDISVQIAHLSTAVVHHARSVACKAAGKFNATVWEELQRWARIPGAKEIIGTALTGGRKMGDINLIVSNEPGQFLDKANGLDILGNIQSWAIGYLGSSEDRKGLAHALSSGENGFSQDVIERELERIAASSNTAEAYNGLSSELSSAYNRAFLICLNQAVLTVGKVMLPDYIAESSLFKTGTSRDPEETVLDGVLSQSVDDGPHLETTILESEVDKILASEPTLPSALGRGKHAAMPNKADSEPSADDFFNGIE
jgi:hypothetical protein